MMKVFVVFVYDSRTKYKQLSDLCLHACNDLSCILQLLSNGKRFLAFEFTVGVFPHFAP